MTATAAAVDTSDAALGPTPARRRFFRQGQLASAVIGGVLASVITGLVPARIELVPTGSGLPGIQVAELFLWFGPALAGMALGYVAWVLTFEHRRPTVFGRAWSAERDWAITGAVFAAFLLGRLLGPSTDVATGVYETGDPTLVLRVDAPADVAITLVRYLATAGISAVLLRVAMDWWGDRRRGPTD